MLCTRFRLFLECRTRLDGRPSLDNNDRRGNTSIPVSYYHETDSLPYAFSRETVLNRHGLRSITSTIFLQATPNSIERVREISKSACQREADIECIFAVATHHHLYYFFPLLRGILLDKEDWLYGGEYMCIRFCYMILSDGMRRCSSGVRS